MAHSVTKTHDGVDRTLIEAEVAQPLLDSLPLPKRRRIVVSGRLRRGLRGSVRRRGRDLCGLGLGFD
jgi:hypothetical protein